VKAVVVEEFGAYRNARIEECPAPELDARGVLVDVCNAGVNAPDLLMISGRFPMRLALPFTPGMEFAGTVAAVGPEVTEVAVGDRVAGEVDYGAYAEQVLVSADSCYRIPEKMSFAHAAALGLSYQTAHFGLNDRAHMSAGERVLVNGAAGGVGLAAVQLVKALGGIAMAGVISDEQAEVALAAGADHVVDLAADNLRDSLREQVMGLTNDHGADVILDPVGGEVFDASLRALAWSGRLVVVGFASGKAPTVEANYLLLKNISVIGLHWRQYRLREPDWVRRIQNDMYSLYQKGRLTPRVMHTYPLEQFADALEIIEAGRVNGKMVLSVRDEHESTTEEKSES
jgi:NADPH2:quinone reductase